MFGVFLAFALGAALVAVLRAAAPRNNLFTGLILLGYPLRLAFQSVIRTAQFFSHEAGSDADGYEGYAQIIAALWQHKGIHFVTPDEFPDRGPTVLPSNMFALAIYANGGPTELGCTAIVAFAAALTVVNIYALAIQFGATQRSATLIASLLYFDPVFFHYTSDTFKDGIVICLTIGALASAIRLTFKFSTLHAAVGALCLLGLWYVRFYLVFVTVAPLLVGLVGFGSKSAKRPLMALLVMLAAMALLVSFTDVLQLASERASETFQHATSADTRQQNAGGGSGVEFDDGGSAYGALGPKLIYTLFSPFPWSSGSLGFHLGKIDSLLWYFLIYRAARTAPSIDRRLLLMLLTFLVPCTVMYAMSMANVGLIVRQRLVIVGATAIIAALYRDPVTQAVAIRGRTAQEAASARPLRT
jgi:hypothetical protein